MLEFADLSEVSVYKKLTLLASSDKKNIFPYGKCRLLNKGVILILLFKILRFCFHNERKQLNQKICVRMVLE